MNAFGYCARESRASDSEYPLPGAASRIRRSRSDSAPIGSGTGTLVSADGLILTVNYMIMGAQSAIVTLASGEQVPAQVVARDFTTSLGVLQIDGRGHPHIEPVSSTDCELGQEIFMVSSLGEEKRCADTGVITYLGPFDAAWEFVLERCVCVTASALNIGLSGGPICNSKGQLIAVSYLNFADLVRPILGIPGECFHLRAATSWCAMAIA